ncbi:Hypothetical protein GLP15_4643 [Giardia lamblia P15]|uniref:Uncharacterized protein n=1 Tax=Giardia intestinalis (strain P15) TaxID=658858 RepID=E1F5Q6_GIAIA|nr:Hypothetical protein GLP15_4643 [Giardia lamblia P15]
MCSRWEQRLFTKEVSDALLVARDAVEYPQAELTPISKHFNLDGLDYAMCFVTRHKGSNQQEELDRHCFGSTSARLENCPRMNSHDISVLTHFGLPCSFLLYACTDRSLGYPLKTSIPPKDSVKASKSTESLLQLLELLVYLAATRVHMDQMYPFLIQVPIYQQKHSVTMFALRGWYRSCHMSGIINGMGVSSSFGIGEMKNYACLQNSHESTETHSVDSLRSVHALTLLRDARDVIRSLSRYSTIGPVPLLSCYYTDILASASTSLSRTPNLPYNGHIVRRMDPLQRTLSFSDLKDFVTDALGRSKSQRHIAAKNSIKTVLVSLSKSLKVNTEEILWPLIDIFPTDVNKNVYLNNVYQSTHKHPFKCYLNVTLSRIIPLDFPLTAHVPRMYLNSIATGIPSNFGSIWKIFAGCPAEAFNRGKAIESVVLYCYVTDFDQDFLTIYANILHRIRSNLETGASVSLLEKEIQRTGIDAFKKKHINNPATNINSTDCKWSLSKQTMVSINNYKDSYIIYVKKLTEYRQARALEYKRNTIVIGDSTLPVLLPVGIPLHNSLHVLSLAIHFGLAAIESFGAESADIDDAPVWAFAPFFAELSQTDDLQKVVPGCAAVANLLFVTEKYLQSSCGQSAAKNMESVSTDCSIYISHNTTLAALALAEEQSVTLQKIIQNGSNEILASHKVLNIIIDCILGCHHGVNANGDKHYHGRRRAPLKKPPYYSSPLSQQFYSLHNERHCPENCLLCRLAGVASGISEAQGVLVLVKTLFSRLISMFRNGDSTPYVGYTFEINWHTNIYQVLVKANQCLKLYQASTSNNSNNSSMSFDDREKTLTKFGLNKVTLSLPSPTFYDLKNELSKEPRNTVLYSLLCKNFLYFLLQAGAQLSERKISEETLVKGVLEHMLARGDYAGYAPKDLVDVYPSMFKEPSYTNYPPILTSEALSIIPIGRATGILTFVPKTSAILSEDTLYLCLIYPYPNSFVEQCARAVVRDFIDLENGQEKKTLLERMWALRETALDLDFYDIGLRALESLFVSESTEYILYTLASIRAINYMIEMSEVEFEAINGVPLFDALLECSPSSDQEDRATKYSSLIFPKLPNDRLLLLPIRAYKGQPSSGKDILLVTMKRNMSLFKQMCAPYYRREYIIACSSLLSEALGIQLPLAYTMCFQPVALDPGERDLAFRRIEKRLLPLFWEATLITSFMSGDDIQHHRCYMQFLKPDLVHHLFTPTFRHCVGFTLSNSVLKSKKQEL